MYSTTVKNFKAEISTYKIITCKSLYVLSLGAGSIRHFCDKKVSVLCAFIKSPDLMNMATYRENFWKGVITQI